jgi:hypothetical protein
MFRLVSLKKILNFINVIIFVYKKFEMLDLEIMKIRCLQHVAHQPTVPKNDIVRSDFIPYAEPKIYVGGCGCPELLWNEVLELTFHCG